MGKRIHKRSAWRQVELRLCRRLSSMPINRLPRPDSDLTDNGRQVTRSNCRKRLASGPVADAKRE